MTYDAGDYEACLDKALELADYKGLAARKAESAKKGMKRGIGFSAYIEACGIAPSAGGRLARRRRRPVGVGRGARQSDRLGGGADRLAQPRPGPRDHVRPARLAAARHPHRAGHGRARRHRQGAVRHGHLRLALRRRRHVGDLLRHRQGDREGQEGGGLRAGGAARTPSTSRTASSPARPPTRRSPSPRWRCRPTSPTSSPARSSSRASRKARSSIPPTSPSRRACTSASWRSIPRPARPASTAGPRSTTSARSINPMIVEGQVHGGIAQGVGQAMLEGAVYDKEGQLRDRELHGLLHAARRRPAVLQGGHDRHALPVEPAGHQGLRRGRRHRRAGRRHQRHHRRARPRGDRHAGDAAGGLARGAESRPPRWPRNRETRPMYAFEYHRPQSLADAAKLLASTARPSCWPAATR